MLIALRPRRMWLVCLGCLVVCAVVVAPAVAETTDEAVALLSTQRTTNGIPGHLAVDRLLSRGCANHIAYLRANPSEFYRDPHGENPHLPGYTTLGASTASMSELSSGVYWSAEGNIWDAGTFGPYPGTYAPLHELGLLRPQATEAWYADWQDPSASIGYSCMGVSGMRTFRSRRFFSYPGNGRAGVSPGVLADIELPVNPAQLVGLPRNQPTGPNILVWAEGPFHVSPHIVRMVLRSAKGRVAIRKADPRNRLFGEQWLYPGEAIIVPIHPLAGDTAHTLMLTWQAGRRKYAQRVHFTTRVRP
jgi:hypothetical protein